MKEKKLPVFNIERFAIHDGPGIRTCVFLQGCSLHCQWCANPESQTVGRHLMFFDGKCVGCGRCKQVCSQKALTVLEGCAEIDRTRCVSCGVCAEQCLNDALQISGQWMSAEEIFEVVERDAAYYRQTGGGLTLSGGEALLHAEALIPLLLSCKENGISVAIETCGQLPEENVDTILPYTDLFLFDIKTLDRECLKTYTGGDLTVILNNFMRIAQSGPQKLIIRVPVIPGVNDGLEAIGAIYELAINCGVHQVDLLPYHTLGMAKYKQLGMTYPFDQTEALRSEKLIPYREYGMTLGLTVTIGG